MNFAQTVKKNHQERMEASKAKWLKLYALECRIVRQRNQERMEAIEQAAAEKALEAAQIREMMEA